MESYHTPVLLNEIIEYLNVQKGSWYVDATLGGGGHIKAILEHGGKVLGIDVDEDALSYVKRHFKKYLDNKSLVLVKGNFANIDTLIKEYCPESPMGIIYDLGVSSHQLSTEDRGFSFNSDGFLDMRMDQGMAVTAKDVINGFSKKELEKVFRGYGEERFAGKIADLIVKRRANKTISTCGELSRLVAEAKKGGRYEKINPATKVFQALRIAVNSELENLKVSLPRALRAINSKGRVVIVSFHSLEDRIVKDFGKKTEGLLVITKKPIRASISEVSNNPKSRSACLRVFEKL